MNTRRLWSVGAVAAEISGVGNVVLEGPLRPASSGMSAGLFHISRHGVVSAPAPYQESGEDFLHQIGLEVDVDVISPNEAILNSWTPATIDGFAIHSENDRRAVRQLVDQLSDEETRSAEERELNDDWP